MIGAVRTQLYDFKTGGPANAVMIGVPVYAKGTSRTTIADRRRNLTGFIVGLFDLPLLLRSIRATSKASPALAITVLPPAAGRQFGRQRARRRTGRRHRAPCRGDRAVLADQAAHRRCRLAFPGRARCRQQAHHAPMIVRWRCIRPASPSPSSSPSIWSSPAAMPRSSRSPTAGCWSLRRPMR